MGHTITEQEKAATSKHMGSNTILNYYKMAKAEGFMTKTMDPIIIPI